MATLTQLHSQLTALRSEHVTQDILTRLDDELELLKGDLAINRTSRAEKEQLDACEHELLQIRERFRRAKLDAKKASDLAKAHERQVVFQNITSPPTTAELPSKAPRRKHAQLTKEDMLVNASTDVTSALRRTHDLLATELSRSRFAQETFDESSAALNELGEKYSNLDNILTNSRTLLSTLLRSQKSDTWYLETAFYILLTTLVWLVFRRILYGPFFKLPAFLWRIFAVMAHWIILKPSYYVCLAVGIIRIEPVPLPVKAEPSTTRPPLIIKPSATDFPVIQDREEFQRHGIPVGVGGAGAKIASISEVNAKIDYEKQEL